MCVSVRFVILGKVLDHCGVISFHAKSMLNSKVNVTLYAYSSGIFTTYILLCHATVYTIGIGLMYIWTTHPPTI